MKNLYIAIFLKTLFYSLNNPFYHLMSDITRQVKIKLVTRETDLVVPNAPLFVPVSLKRYGLSEVVNQLLELEKSIPFDFLIDGQLLRSSLDSYLTVHGLSSETTLTLEYARSILPPSFLSSFAHQDWVSSVHISRLSPFVATGSYDGIARLWDLSGKVTHQLVGHNAAVKTVQWTDEGRLVTGSSDRNLCLWRLKEGEENPQDVEVSALAVLQGHTGSVDDVACRGTSIVSGSADTTVKLWSTNYKELPAPSTANDSGSTASQKRRKLAEKNLASARVRGPLGSLTGHTSPVTGVVFHASDSQVAYSVSQDHTIRTWDLATQTLIDTRTTSFPLLSITTLAQAGLIACGSSARHITLHDPRTTTSTTQAQLIGHTNFVVSLAPSPDNQYMFASGSHDGTTKIWDIRAQKSIYTITRESGESPTAVYGVDWHTSIGITSVGQDKKLQINSGGFSSAM